MLLLISPLSHRPTLHTKPPLCFSSKQSLCLIFPSAFSFLHPIIPHTTPVEICALQLITEYKYWMWVCILTTLAWYYSFLAHVIIKSFILRYNTFSSVFQGFFQSARILWVLSTWATLSRKAETKKEKVGTVILSQWESCGGSWENTLDRIIKVTESTQEDFLRITVYFLVHEL